MIWLVWLQCKNNTFAFHNVLLIHNHTEASNSNYYYENNTNQSLVYYSYACYNQIKPLMSFSSVCTLSPPPCSKVYFSICNDSG